MGVPKFFAFLSERYPCLSKRIDQSEVPEFDNLYLDMNGIIHPCSHPDDANPFFRITEEDIFLAIFKYIEFLFKTIKPRKLFFMAVDGVAPRAKMNQQRGRRFRTAKDIENQERKAREQGDVLPTEERFDSNCITPGTVFMDRLHKQLQFFVVQKISTDPLWQGCTVILSGHETPGEGEHKIMDYIRYMKSQPDWDPNTSHCLYGLDADLIILGLCTHDPNFCLLREEVQFGKKKKTTVSAAKTTFFLLHLSLLRDYLDLEFKELKESLTFPYDIERIVDDWILMGYLVGNDFIPHLPNLHIHGGALPHLYKTYKEVLPTLDGYINENGYLNLPRFQAFMARIAELEFANFEEENGDLLFLEHKTGRRMREWDEPETAPQRPADLQALIDATNEILDTDDSEEDEKDNVKAEFEMHKKHYYNEKLEFENVTEDVLKSQAEGYVRAIQWILHYYYHGCQSWSWFFPHHYTPYISDITNFKDVDLSFDMGKPFLPFHQLLAVLPPGSKTLLPEAYQPLLTSEDSPIIDFYPPEFETDLNGKLQDYEALVLIPFINEERLLAAMDSCSDKLTEDEIRRNTHGPMQEFKYSKSSLGIHKSPGYFPDVVSNHATVRAISREEIHVEPNPKLFRRHPDLDPNVYTPGFPSLRFLPHEGKLMLGKVQVFNFPSRRDNMIISLKERELLSTKDAAKQLVGKVVYVGWPHMQEALVSDVADSDIRYSSTGQAAERTDLWESRAAGFHRDYMTRWGIDVGKTEVLVFVNRLKCQKYTVTDEMKISCDRVWSTEKESFPLQIIVKDIKVLPPKRKAPIAPHELYPIDAPIILLEKPCYGAFGCIIDNSAVDTNGTVKVELKIKEEIPFRKADLLQMSDDYMYCNQASRMAQCSGLVFAKITGRLKGKGNTIGLNLKFNSRNQQVPGYTKKEGNAWLYSKKTVVLVRKYLDAFPALEEFYQNKDNNEDNDGEDLDEIFGEGKGAEKKKEIKAWLDENLPKSAGLMPTNSVMLGSAAVAKLDAAYRNLKAAENKSVMKVKAKHLFKADLVQGSVSADSSVDYELLDRVVSCTTQPVPFGLQGYIIAISSNDKGKPDSLIVLFDETFPEGSGLLGCESPRVSCLSPSAVINITATQRDPSVSKSERSILGKAPYGYQSGRDNRHRNAMMDNFLPKSDAFSKYSDNFVKFVPESKPTMAKTLEERHNFGHRQSAFAPVQEYSASPQAWRRGSSSNEEVYTKILEASPKRVLSAGSGGFKTETAKNKTVATSTGEQFFAQLLGKGDSSRQVPSASSSSGLKTETGRNKPSDFMPNFVKASEDKSKQSVNPVNGVKKGMNDLYISKPQEKKDNQLTPSVQNFFSQTSDQKFGPPPKNIASTTESKPKETKEKNPLFEALMKARTKQVTSQQHPVEQPLQQQLPLPPAQWQSPSDPIKAIKKDFVPSHIFVNSKTGPKNQPSNPQPTAQNTKPSNTEANEQSIQQFFERYPQYNAKQHPSTQSQFTPPSVPQQWKPQTPNSGKVQNSGSKNASDPIKSFLNQYPQHFPQPPRQRPMYAPYVPPAARNTAQKQFSPFSQQMIRTSGPPPIVIQHSQRVMNQMQPPPLMSQMWHPPANAQRSPNSRGPAQSMEAKPQNVQTVESLSKENKNSNPFVPLQAITGTKVTRSIAVPRPRKTTKKEEVPVPEPIASSSIETKSTTTKLEKPRPRRRIAANLNFPTD